MGYTGPSWLPKFCPLTGVMATMVATCNNSVAVYFFCVVFYIYVLFYSKRIKVTNIQDPSGYWIQNGFFWGKKLEDQSEG